MGQSNDKIEKIYISKENALIYYDELLKNYAYDTKYLYNKVPMLKNLIENEILKEVTGINVFNIHFDKEGQWKWLKDRMEIINKNSELKSGFIPQELFSRIETLFKERNAAEHKKDISSTTYKYHLETVAKVICLFSGIAIPKEIEEIVDLKVNKKKIQGKTEEDSTGASENDYNDWSGYYFVNTGISDDPARKWEYNVKFKFISGGNKNTHTNQIKGLKKGDRIFAYFSGKGYVGYGIVKEEAVIVKKFTVNGKKLLDEMQLPKDHKWRQSKNPDEDEWMVKMDWLKTFNENDAKTFTGIFAIPSTVCKLYKRHKKTIDFLKRQFGIDNGNP